MDDSRAWGSPASTMTDMTLTSVHETGMSHDDVILMDAARGGTPVAPASLSCSDRLPSLSLSRPSNQACPAGALAHTHRAAHEDLVHSHDTTAPPSQKHR